ncbi:hypothetical protein BD289DRAFT_215737 [Coniella lustricola]|uniref:Uncharacterized protein n=1 Tax=Coniella lustricola TaxID=2025994 RepID=A0A2T2ZS31_9PEZI|nr:hypothetical protein BD289DRAFT_215737 [Coniella lustricola]
MQINNYILITEACVLNLCMYLPSMKGRKFQNGHDEHEEGGCGKTIPNPSTNACVRKATKATSTKHQLSLAPHQNPTFGCIRTQTWRSAKPIHSSQDLYFLESTKAQRPKGSKENIQRVKTHTQIYIYIYICMYVCMYVFVKAERITSSI